MPAERRFGMDHEHYEWSPLSKRGVLKWQDDARVALCEHLAVLLADLLSAPTEKAATVEGHWDYGECSAGASAGIRRTIDQKDGSICYEKREKHTHNKQKMVRTS